MVSIGAAESPQLPHLRFYEQINLKTIDNDRLKKADAKMLSFFNVNTPEALQNSLRVAEGKDRPLIPW